MLSTTFLRAQAVIRRILALLGLVCIMTAASAKADTVRQLDIADYRAYLADDHPVRQGMRKFAELAAASSAGSLRVTVRTSALPGSAAQQIATLQAGATDAPALMLVASTGLAPQVKAFGLLDLPFLVRDKREADALLDGPFGQALLARLAPSGLVGLAWWENGFRQITTSGEPVRRVEDLRGLNLRVIGEPVFAETVRAMGANPVPLPFPELHAALKSGRVDGQDNFMSQILAGRLHEVQSSLSLTNHSYSALVLVANARFWSTLSAAQQNLLLAAATEAGRAQREAARAEASAAGAALAAQGLLVHEVSSREIGKLRALTAPLRERYFADNPDYLRQLYQAETARGTTECKSHTRRQPDGMPDNNAACKVQRGDFQ
jgi:tripartite ATP-independent transporter DctP family solute receptor